VRPQIAESVLKSLRFRADHHVISIIATFSVRRLQELMSPATKVERAVPLLSTAKCESPTVIYPSDPEALELFSLIGAPFAVDTEQEFDALCTATAAVASYFVFADAVVSWLAERGIPGAIARDYMAQILPSLEESAAKAPTSSFRAMAADHATAGGLNEQLLNYLEERNTYGALTEALDQVMLRVTTTNH
jgi:pyrroline-5-carboxylate reductase